MELTKGLYFTTEGSHIRKDGIIKYSLFLNDGHYTFTIEGSFYEEFTTPTVFVAKIINIIKPAKN